MRCAVTIILFSSLISWNILGQSSPMVVEATVAEEGVSAIFARALVPESNPPMVNVGVRGISNASNGIGVRGDGNTGMRGIGAFGVIGDGTSRAGFFSGSLEYTGTLVGPSDRKLKTVYKSNETFLDRLMQLRPTKYKYKSEEYRSLKLPTDEQYGFIAQEIEKVFPNLVKESVSPQYYGENGELIAEKVEYKSVSLIGLIPIMTKCIQELNQSNMDYRVRIETLEKELTLLKSMIIEK